MSLESRSLSHNYQVRERCLNVRLQQTATNCTVGAGSVVRHHGIYLVILFEYLNLVSLCHRLLMTSISFMYVFCDHIVMN